jgi:hypothetical protein
VVNCVLALKSYGDWKQCGGTGPWKYGGNLKPSVSGKSGHGRKNSEPFRRSQSINEGEVPYEEAGFNGDAHFDSSDMVSSSSNFLVAFISLSSCNLVDLLIPLYVFQAVNIPPP